MDPVFNLTQHDPTPSQEADGVCPRPPELKALISELLTVRGIPTKEQLERKAEALVDLAKASGCDRVMIGGLGPLMRLLAKALVRRGLVPIDSFSERVSEDVLQDDGSVKKVFTFAHIGWGPLVD